MSKFFSPDQRNVEAASLADAAQIYGQMIANRLDNTLISVTETGYTQAGSGMNFTLRFEQPIMVDRVNDPRELLIFVGQSKH